MKEARDTRPYHIQLRQKKLSTATRMTAIGTDKKPSKFRSAVPDPENNEDVKKEAAPKKAPAAPAGKKGKKKMKQRTKNQAKTMKTLAINYGPYLEKNPICAIMSPVCTCKATTVNHKAGRGVTAVLDKNTWEPSCDPCNGYIEAHHEWAVQQGHKTTRLAKPKKFIENGL